MLLKRLRPPRRRLLLLLLLLAGVYVGVCYSLALSYIRPARTAVVRPDWLVEALVPTRFGPDPAWCSPGLASGKPSHVVFVMVHGYGGSRQSWEFPMRDLEQRGFDSVTMSMPGQDASPAKEVGFGISEAHVVADTVKWVHTHSQTPVKVVVLGVSMGGAATWIATGETTGIDGVITDSAYARFDQAMNQFFDRKLPSGHIPFKPVIWIAEAMTGLRPEKVRPVDFAAKWKGRPALIIQGRRHADYPGPRSAPFRGGRMPLVDSPRSGARRSVRHRSQGIHRSRGRVRRGSSVNVGGILECAPLAGALNSARSARRLRRNTKRK